MKRLLLTDIAPERESGVRLVDQLVERLKGAIIRNRCRAGMVLPGMLEIAAAANVSEKVVRTAGSQNCIWVAMDYTDIMVHIFLPEARDFYNLDELWQDAPTTQIEDVE